MRLPVRIIILFTFIETLCFGKAQDAQVFRASACFGSHKCPFYRMNCTEGGVVHVLTMKYGLRGSREQSCIGFSGCESGEPFCCSDLPDDCLKNFTKDDALNVTKYCSGVPFCGPFRATRDRIDTPNNCFGEFSQYVVINYTCLQGTDTTVQLTSTTNGLSPSGNKSSSSGKSVDGISVAAIIGVVIAAIIVIVVVAVALVIFKRRQKKGTKDDTHISNLPKGLTDHMYERSVEVVKSSEVVETANYDVISDESVLNYSLPEKDKKGTTNIHVTVDKYNDVSTDEYDKIEFKMKGAMKVSSYDHLAAWKGKIGDDSYSDVSNGSKSVTIATSTVNDYSHCKPNSKDTLKNGDDYSHCKPNSKDTLENGDDYSHCKPNSKDTLGNGDDYSHCKPNSKDTPRNGDDYSHAALERDCTIKPESDINEEDSYNHIGFGDTKHPM